MDQEDTDKLSKPDSTVMGTSVPCTRDAEQQQEVRQGDADAEGALSSRSRLFRPSLS
jgi:hypothetical protein